MAAGPDFFLRCPQCGAKNRIPPDRIDEQPRCGRCRADIPVKGVFSGRPLIVTDSSFERDVLKSPLPVLLDCWAPWCGPCRSMAPVIDQLAMAYKGRVRVAKLNTDEQSATAARFDIRSIPTLLIFDRGRLVDTLVGALPRAQIEDRIKGFI